MYDRSRPTQYILLVLFSKITSKDQLIPLYHINLFVEPLTFVVVWLYCTSTAPVHLQRVLSWVCGSLPPLIAFQEVFITKHASQETYHICMKERVCKQGCLLLTVLSIPLLQATVKKAMSEFRRTHYDSWSEHKLKFTDDQLAVLADLLISPSYYA